MRRAAWCGGWVLVLGIAGSAAAGDYTVAETSGGYVAPPPTATDLQLGDDESVLVQLPFEFRYFGRIYDEIHIHSNGYAQIEPAVDPDGFSEPNNETFPPEFEDAVLAPFWDDLDPTTSGSVFTAPIGTAPNRQFIIFWDDVALFADPIARVTFNLVLHEDGVIEFVYEPDSVPSTWFSTTYSSGIEAPGDDDRFVVPDGDTGNLKMGHPGTNFRITPESFDVSATILFDKVVADATGIGNSTRTDVPVGGVRVELRDERGVAIAVTHSDAEGRVAFANVPPQDEPGALIAVLGRSDADLGDLIVGADPFVPTPTEFALRSSLELCEDLNLGTIQIDDTLDPGADFRRPLNIFLECCRVQDRYGPRLDAGAGDDTLSVLWDELSTADALFTPPASDGDPAILRIPGPATTKPGAWQDDLVRRLYLRYYLFQSTGAATISPEFSDEFDAASSELNALLGGICYALASPFAAPGDPALCIEVPPTGPQIVRTFDLESHALVTTPGPDVVGAVAMALHDLRDPANETHDRIDGTPIMGPGGPVGDPEDPILDAIDQFGIDPDVLDFAKAWRADGNDTPGLARIFIHESLFPGDRFEPNDEAGEEFAIGPIGVNVAPRLDLGDVDRFEFQPFDPFAPVQIRLTFDRPVDPADIRVQVVSVDGTEIDRLIENAESPLEIEADFDPASTEWTLQITHEDGDPFTLQGLQVKQPLIAGSGPLLETTAGQPYEDVLGIRGGVFPVSVDLAPGSDPPPLGLQLPPPITVDTDLGVLQGIIADPVQGTFTVRITDSSNPQDVIERERTLTVNPIPQIDPPPHGFYAGRVGEGEALQIERQGGTLPIESRAEHPDLPGGGVDGTPEGGHTLQFDTAGCRQIDFSIIDRAGATQQVTVPFYPCLALPLGKEAVTPIGAGSDGGGFFFRVPRDTLISITMSLTEQEGADGEKPMRNEQLGFGPFLIRSQEIPGATFTTQPVILDPLAPAPQKRASVKVTPKKIIAKNILLEDGGLYYLVALKESGGVADFKARVKLTPPKKGKDAVDDFGPGSETLEIPFGAFDGASVKFSLKTDRKAGNAVVITGLRAPDGTVIAGADLGIVTRKTKLSFTRTLDQFGTWTVLVDAADGPAGGVKYSLKIKQPKGVRFVTD